MRGEKQHCLLKYLIYSFILTISIIFAPQIVHAGLLSTTMDIYEYETILYGNDDEPYSAIVYQMTNLTDENGITGVFIATKDSYNYSIGYINDPQHPAWNVVRLNIIQGDTIYAQDLNGDKIYFNYLPDSFSTYDFGYFYYEGLHDGASQSLKIGETINGYVIGGALESPYVYTHDYNPQGGSYNYVGAGETRHPNSATVPEPMSILLFATGILGAARMKRR